MKIQSLSPRNVPIGNEYHLKPNQGDYTVSVHYISENQCQVHVQRHDEDFGWGFIELIIDETEVIQLGSSKCTCETYTITTITKLFPISLQNQAIPKLIVQTMETNNCEGYSLGAYESITQSNPEYEYVFFNAVQRRRFIQRHFRQEVLEAYDILVPGAYQADLFRYCYLYINGGCYLDFKTIQRVPFRDIIKTDDKFLVCIDSFNKAIDNSIILTTSGNPLLMEMINACVNNILLNQTQIIQDGLRGDFTTILDITGSTLFYKVIMSKNSDLNPMFKHNIINYDETQYKNFQIIHIDTKHVLFTKKHKDYCYQGLYNELWTKGEIFYKNIQQLKHHKVMVYPHPYNDVFSFTIQNNKLYVYRAKGGWGLELKIKLVDYAISETRMIYVGKHDNCEKVVDL